PQIRLRARTHRSLAPRIKPAPRDLEQSAHHPHRMGGLVGLHEPEERFEGPLSVANQAAAFERISRSSFSRRFSRRSRVSSSRSAVVRPPSPWPASRASCLPQRAIVQAEGPNSLARDAAVRPDLSRPTICRLNSGVYRTVRFAINTSVPYVEVSTKPGQLQNSARNSWNRAATVKSVGSGLMAPDSSLLISSSALSSRDIAPMACSC